MANKHSKKYRIKKEVFDRINAEIFGTFLFFVTIFIIFSLFTNKVGIIGIFIRNIIKGTFGIGSFLILLLLIYISLDSIIKREKISKSVDVILFTYFIFINILFTSINGIIKQETLFIDMLKESFFAGQEFNGFGLFGFIITYPLYKLIGQTGTIIFSVAVILLFSMLITQFSIRNAIKKNKKFRRIDKSQNTDNEIEQDKERNFFNHQISEEKKENTLIDFKIKSELLDKYNQGSFEDKKNNDIKKKNKIEKENNPFDNQLNIQNTDYKYPLIDFLKKPSDSNIISKKEINDNVRKLEETLKSFGIEAVVTEVSIGPTITRYELQPGQGVKVSRIVNLSDDIALSLAAASVRIEAPIPNKSAIGIEIPNKEPRSVFIRELLEDQGFFSSTNKIPFTIGKDIAGSPIIGDISKMPHLLIAGATGSGKSVCINSLIISILYRCHPNDVKLILVDPKVVELSVYNGVPHLLIPVVTDAKKAANALNWAVGEMNSRYKMFAQAGVRDIIGYNKLCEKNGTQKLPYVVIVIDELADLMMVSPTEVEDSICRLAQMARAAGMHLVVATQRPSVDVITGVIKANIPSRIAFAVSSQVDSRTILDSSGAEKLLGRGDMLYLPMGINKPIRVQGCFVSDQEVERVVEYLKSNIKCEYNEEIVEQISKVNNDFDDQEKDELFLQALQVIVESQNASTSFLQRKLKIGYARAARILDQMEAKGIVSKMDSNKTRQVLITKDQFNEMLMNME
ncbi:DNA translocase FtsK [Caldicellulosiruptoraceae bacterium PP1]